MMGLVVVCEGCGGREWESVYFVGGVGEGVDSSTCGPYSLTSLQCQRVSNEACFRIHA